MAPTIWKDIVYETVLTRVWLTCCFWSSSRGTNPQVTAHTHTHLQCEQQQLGLRPVRSTAQSQQLRVGFSVSTFSVSVIQRE